MSDAVTTEIIRGSLVAIAEEMAHTLSRAAHSPIIYDMKDFSVAVFNAESELLGQAPGLPLFLGGLDHALAAVAEAVDPNPGDAYALNDPYICGSHVNDVTVVMPIFVDMRLAGWAATKAHWEDVGAADAGLTTASKEVFQEGLRFGPTRVQYRGEWEQDIVQLLRANSRTPKTVMGDLAAQVAACRVGAREFVRLLRRFGREVVEASTSEMFADAARREAAFVRSIRDGTYECHAAFDNDGVHFDEPVGVWVRLEIKGDMFTVDLTRASAQRSGPTNAGRAQTVSAARLAFRYLSHDRSPICGGNFRSLRVRTTPGTIFDAKPPAACMFYGTPLALMINLIFRAIAPELPHRVIAGQSDSASNVLITGRNSDGGAFTAGEATAIGWGGRHGGDGASACIDSMGGDLKNHPIETLEARYPVRIRRYSLRTDSAGAGVWRGGCGVQKSYEVLRDGLDLTLWFERGRTPGWGLFGGAEGAPPAVRVLRGGRTCLENLKVNHWPLRAADVIEASTGGGGGYGKPAARARDLIFDDILDEYLSLDEAASEYDLSHEEISAISQAVRGDGAVGRRSRDVPRDDAPDGLVA